MWTAANIPNMKDKTILVTGANSGIGYYTALELARNKAHVILGCRNIEKANDTLKKIKNEIPNAKVEIGIFDLGDLNSIKEYADNFIKTKGKLDILINNAGIMTPQIKILTKDGFEVQWGTNFLGHFALTGLLLKALEQGSNSRIVTVTSIAYRNAKIIFDDLNAEKNYVPMDYYKQSKLADTIFGIELEKRLRANNKNIISLESHPGISRTELLPNSYEIQKNFKSWLMKVFTRLGMPASQGALPSLYAATSPDVEGGKLYGPHSFNGTRGYPVEEKYNSAAIKDKSIGSKLWAIAEKQTGVSYL